MIERSDIASQVADQERQLIVTGDLAGGSRINETHLAERLRVSRTPVREALRRLAGEGAVVSMPNLGFFVAEMSAAELDEVYVLRPQLDVVALRLGGPPSAATLAQMRRVNGRLARARSAAEAVDLDDQWHRLLLSRCTNTTLLDFIDRLIARTRRYELLLFADEAQRASAADQHGLIMDALEAGKAEEACLLLAGYLTRGDAPLRSAIEARAGEEA